MALSASTANFDDVAHLAIHETRNPVRFRPATPVKLRPFGVGQGCRALAKGQIQPCPELFCEMRRERRGNCRNGFACTATVWSAKVLASFMNTIIAEMAVLKRIASRSSVTFLMHVQASLVRGCRRRR